MKITTSAADILAWRGKNAWIEDWLTTHEVALPDHVRGGERVRRRLRWLAGAVAWDEMRKQQKREERK